MTRVETIISQVLELTPTELEEFFQRMDQIHEPPLEGAGHGTAAGFDGALTNEQLEEFNRRIDDFKSGRTQGIPAEEVFRNAEAALRERRRPA